MVIALLELASMMEVEITAILVLIARTRNSEILWLVLVVQAQSKLQQYISIEK